MPLEWNLAVFWSDELVDLIDNYWMHARQVAYLLALRVKPWLPGPFQYCLHVDWKGDYLICELLSDTWRIGGLVLFAHCAHPAKMAGFVALRCCSWGNWDVCSCVRSKAAECVCTFTCIVALLSLRVQGL